MSIFLRMLSFNGTTKLARKIIIELLNSFFILNSLVQNLLFVFCIGDILTKTYIVQLWCKIRARFVSLFFCIYQKVHFPFLQQKKKLPNIEGIFVFIPE